MVLAAVTHREAFLPPSPRPLLVSIDLTENCQARCRTCNYWQVRKEEPISTARAKALVDEIAGLDFEYIRWIGGEPLLREDLFEVLAHIPTGRFSKVILGTNGLLLDRYADQINDSCLTNVSVSLDGFGKTNELLRGIDFETVRRGLGRLKGKRIKIASVVTKHLAGDIGPLLAWCREMGYDYDIVLPSRVLPYSAAPDIQENLTALWPDARQTEAVLDAMLQSGMTTRSVAADARTFLTKQEYPFRHCLLGYAETRIVSNGDVYGPCFEYGALGNVLRDPLNAILAPERTAPGARRMFRLDCSRCLLGWQMSSVFERPWANLPYAAKRLRSRP